MSISVVSTFDNENEQIINKSEDIDLKLAQKVYSSLKMILQKDKYNLFESKQIHVLDQKIARLNVEIEKIVKLNVTSKEARDVLKKQVTELKNGNQKKLNLLGEKLK